MHFLLGRKGFLLYIIYLFLLIICSGKMRVLREMLLRWWKINAEYISEREKEINFFQESNVDSSLIPLPPFHLPHKVLLFCQTRQMLNIIEEMCVECDFRFFVFVYFIFLDI
jgi:SNF2 family DNA or RNA helicase